MASIAFAWELGAGTGHVATLWPVARALQQQGHSVRFLLRDPAAGADLEGAGTIPREAAPVWTGRVVHPNPLNFGEILLNFGYGHPVPLHALVAAWRERLQADDLIVANSAPAAHLAARTLGLPSVEIADGFPVPPGGFPSPALRDWQPAPRERLEAADRAVLDAMNAVLGEHGARPLAAIGEIFAGRALITSYPELDVYPSRGPAEYFGVFSAGEGTARPEWPPGRGPRVFAYVYEYYKGLPALFEALAGLDCPSLVLCRGLDPRVEGRRTGDSIRFSPEPMSVAHLVPQADLVICHGSHQMTARALLAGKPVLLLPTHLEQFLIMRRVVRQGMGLGIDPAEPEADCEAAIRRLAGDPGFGTRARAFAARYAAHDRDAALRTIVGRCEQAIGERR